MGAPCERFVMIAVYATILTVVNGLFDRLSVATGLAMCVWRVGRGRGQRREFRLLAFVQTATLAGLACNRDLPISPQSQPLRGIVFMLLAMVLAIPVMNAMAKTLALEFHIVQVIWARFTGHLLCVIVVFWPTLRMRLFKSENYRMQFSRSLLMFISNACFISALPLVTLGTASAIMMTGPIIITALAVPLLGERVGWHRWQAVILGLIGALIIIRPDPALNNTGNLLVAGSALAFAFYQIYTRKMANVDRPETLIVFTALVASVVTSLIVPWYFIWPESLWHLALFLLLGAMGALSQFLVIKAVQCAPVSVVSPFQYTELIGATVMGFLVFGSLPDQWTWVGAALVVVAGLYIAWRERVRQRV